MIEYTLSPGPGRRSLVRLAVSPFVRLDRRLAAPLLRVTQGAAQRKADRKPDSW
jgi:hypothetical protein